MIYTKDGYDAAWVYDKAPTNFNLIQVSGVSKNELYFLEVYTVLQGTPY